jgi:hypothetical protein
VHGWQHCVESAPDLQQTQHLLDESGQIFRVSEAAVHISDELEFAELLERILPQALTGEIAQAIVAEARRLLSPLVRPAILDGNRDRVRLGSGPAALFRRCGIVLGCVIVEYGLALARANIQPSVRALEAAERVAKAVGKNLRLVREPSVRDVARLTVSVIDFFLLGEFLVDPRLLGLLYPGSAKRLHRDDGHECQARRNTIPCLRRRFD